MDPKGILTFLRNEASMWAYDDVPLNATVEAQVIFADGTQARVQRSGQSQADAQLYPSIAPYLPKVGDRVLCMRVAGGLMILGTINRQTNDGTHLGQYAKTASPTLTGNPTAPTPDVVDRTETIATTAHVKDVLSSSPELDGTPQAPSADFTDDSNTIATTAHVKAVLQNGPVIVSAFLDGNMQSTRDSTLDFSRGVIKVPAPTASDHAVNKGFVENNYFDIGAINDGYPRRDGTVGFNAPVSGVTPTAVSHLVTKGYADSNYVSPVTLGTYAPLGSPSFTGTPTATTDTVMNPTTRIPTQSWVNAFFAPTKDPVFSSTVTVPTPFSGGHAANKSYVDQTAAAALVNTFLSGQPTTTGSPTNSANSNIPTQGWVNQFFMVKTGGAFTGAVTLQADPVSALGAATKQYVDNRTGGRIQSGQLFNVPANGSLQGTGGLNQVITYPVPYASTPQIFLQVSEPVAPGGVLNGVNNPVYYVTNAHAGNFQIFGFTNDGSSSSFNVSWMAIGN